MPSWVVPSDTHSVGDTGHATDHNHVADDLTLINNVLPVVSGGLTGATAVTRLVGATASGPPVSGTFALGDIVIDQTGVTWICTTAGSPGSWTGSLTIASNAAGNLQVFGSSAFLNNCYFDISTAGKGLQVAEGSNAKQGTATLNGTTSVVVSNTSVTASSRIFLTIQSRGSVNPPGSPYVVTRTAGTSFSIASTVASDNSVVAYEIFEPG